MIIRMFNSMSSGRHDGRVWPPAGVDFEVPDWEGEDLVNGGNAVKVADSPSPAYVPPPEPPPSPEPAPPMQWPPAEPGRMGVSPPEPAPEVVPDVVVPVVVPPEPPRPLAPKQDWVDWAVTRGADADEASAATKQQLMERYGARP